MNKSLKILPYISILLYIACEPDKPEVPDASSKIIITTNEPVTNITINSAVAKGNIVDDGGFDISQSGMCWGINENPTINGSKQISDIRLGEFTIAISGLSPEKVYFVRAYAQHYWGKPIYGNQVSFTTARQVIVPTVTTTMITQVKLTSAQSGGNVTDDGGATVTERGVCWSFLPDPTTANFWAADIKGGKGVFTSNITNLLPDKEYHVRAYAINSKGIGYGEEIKFTTLPRSVTDIDNNNYKIVKIGNQWWMAENLKTTRYDDGTTIPLLEDNSAWINNTEGAMCYYNNNSINKAIYGGMYNWYCTTNNHKLCPSGWHIPSDTEWEELIQTLGPAESGYKLKEAGDAHWKTGNVADNSSGFTGLPGGSRYAVNAAFQYLQTNGYWWSATDSTTTRAFNRNVWYGGTVTTRDCPDKKNAYNIRCILD